MVNLNKTPDAAKEMGVDTSDTSDTEKDKAGDEGKVDDKSQQGGETPDQKGTSPDDTQASQEDKKTSEYWKKQYGASSTEAKRLAAENKQLKGYQEQAEPVISILRSNPDLYSQVQKRAAGEDPTDTDDSWDAEETKRIEQAVQKAISPLMKEQERQSKQRVDKIVDSFRKEKNINDEKWNTIRDYLPVWTAVKNPPSLREAMEKTLHMVDAEEATNKAKEQGRSQAFAEMDAAKDANVPTGGTPAAPKGKADINTKQREAAESMGVKPEEAYGE